MPQDKGAPGSDEAEVLQAAVAFLSDRLDEFEAVIGNDSEQVIREFYGHVRPAQARLKMAAQRVGKRISPDLSGETPNATR